MSGNEPPIQTPEIGYKELESQKSISALQGVKPGLAVDPQLEVRPDPNSQEDQWVTGLKLFNIIAAVALVCLLMLLDTSIISTVCYLELSRRIVECLLSTLRQSLGLPVNFILSLILAGMEVPINLQGMPYTIPS